MIIETFYVGLRGREAPIAGDFDEEKKKEKKKNHVLETAKYTVILENG